MDDVWLRSLVWMDYRLATLFTLFIPLVLSIWAFVKQSEGISRLLIVYWRVSSLLPISIYLAIAAMPISFVCALSYRILIPLSLWFWVDLNEEINDMPPSRPLKLGFTAWRWAVTVYMALGAVGQLPFLRCTILQKADILAQPICSVWLEAPWQFKEFFHRNYTEGFVGFLGIVGLMIYVLYFSYFVLIRLGKQGRTAVES